MRLIPLLLAALPVALPTAALAGPFDGTYRPNYDFAESWDCSSVGQDGGALAVDGNTLTGVENTCLLSAPVEVRDMAAVLYDAQCTGEGETSAARIMLMAHDFGIYVIRDGFVLDWLRCE